MKTKNMNIFEQNMIRLKRAELASKSGNWELHLGSGNITASEGAAGIYGVERSEMDFETIKKIPLSNYRPILDLALKNLIEKNIPYKVEFKIKTFNTGEIKDIYSVAEYDKESNTVFGVIQDITDFKKLENDKIKLLSIVENSSSEIFTFSPATLKLEFANQQALKNLGYSESEIKELTPAKIQTEFTDSSFEKMIEKLINGETDRIFYETNQKRKDGTTYPVEVNLQFRNVNGQSFFFSIINDITEHKRNQEALIQNREFLNNLIETIPLPVFYKDINGKYLGANHAFTSMFGYKKEELINKTVFDLYPPDLARIYFNRDNELINRGGVQVYETQFSSYDGQIHYITVHKATYNNSKNQIAGIIGAMLDITEQKKAEESLKQSEEKYRLLFMDNPVPMWIYDSQTLKFLEVNDFAVDHYGYSREEFLNMTLKDIRPVEQIAYLFDTLDKVKGKLRRVGNVKHCKKDGNLIDVEITAHEIDYEGRKAMFVLAMDITEQKKIESALRESEEKYRTFFELDLTGDFTSTIDGKLLMCNPAYVKILGYDSIEDMMKVTTKSFYKNPEDRVKVIEAIREKKKLENYEITLLKKDGEEVIAIENIYGEFDSNGELILLKGYLFDITAIRRAEEALRESEERFHSMFEKNKAVMFLIDPATGKIIDANNAASEFYGYSLIELKSVNINKINMQSENEIFTALNSAATGKQSYFQYSHKLLSGEVRDVEVYTSPIIIKGEIVLFSIIHDITERKKAEKEVIESREKLRALAARLEQVKEEERILLARELHDNLGQRLTGLKLDTAWLFRRISNYKEEETEVIGSRIKEMSDLIDEIINNVRRISSELRPTILDYIGLIPSLEWLLEDFKKKTETHILFLSDVRDIKVDKSTSTTIFRIFQEAITNIIRHASATFVEMKIQEDDINYVVNLMDNGVGFAEDKINDLKSLGIIGMKERALQIKSELSISNRPEGGTIVTLTIPKGYFS